MHKVIRAGDLQPSPGGTITFQGEPHGSGVSFFSSTMSPEGGPTSTCTPTRRPWVVRSGKARFTADSRDIEAGPGDIVVVGAETPHKFKNIGTSRLEIVCIHASRRMIREE